MFSSSPAGSSRSAQESFGTGSSHIREKDGMWAVLAWMSVLANFNTDTSKPLVGVQEIVENHWARFGRHFYVRYDYEAVDSAAAEEVMETIRGHFSKVADEKGVDRFGELTLLRLMMGGDDRWAGEMSSVKDNSQNGPEI